jgi:hypothetical protein
MKRLRSAAVLDAALATLVALSAAGGGHWRLTDDVRDVRAGTSRSRSGGQDTGDDRATRSTTWMAELLGRKHSDAVTPGGFPCFIRPFRRTGVARVVRSYQNRGALHLEVRLDELVRELAQVDPVLRTSERGPARPIPTPMLGPLTYDQRVLVSGR